MASSAATLPALFLERVTRTPTAEAYVHPSGTGWTTLTWRDVHTRVRDVAGGLVALGLTPEDRCAILSGTRVEWIVADLGTLCAAGATTTIYPSSTPEDCAYIVKDSGSVVVFAENDEQVAKLAGKRGELPGVRAVVTFDGKPSADGWVITLSQLEEKGRAHFGGRDEPLAALVGTVRKDALATLIYTSGTTGKPKGVELTQDCWVYEAEGIDALGILRPDDVQYLWLPLAHSFGKVLQVAQLRVGFKTAVDGRVDKLVENLAVIRPTFVAAVPRIFEKVHARVVAGAHEGSAAKSAVFEWAFGVGRRVSELRQRGQEPVGLLAIQNMLADKLVFSKIKARFGGRLRFFVSGSAPLNRNLAEFFHRAGILILEGYGLTESSAASFVNIPQRFRFGTVGPPLPGTEVKIAPSDGEVLIRSRGVMRGYHGMPEATAEALDAEGFLHTGDIGALEDGLLRITDRKKDLIKTSGGKYVAPQILEGKLKLAGPVISQVLIDGDNRNFCTALIALDPEALGAWAKANGLGDLGYKELTEHPRVVELVEGYVHKANSDLASFESIRRFAILPADLTMESGDLTPSLKLKRKVVEQKYRAILDGFYA